MEYGEGYTHGARLWCEGYRCETREIASGRGSGSRGRLWLEEHIT
jgi:hypothetical protein